MPGVNRPGLNGPGFRPVRRFFRQAPLARANGPTNYVLTASPGTFTLTGQSVTLRVSRTLTSSPGAYTLAGQSVNMRVGKGLTAGVGTFALAGQSAALRVARTLTASSGAYTWAGQSVNMRVGAGMTAASGSYALAGQSVTLRTARSLTALSGSYTITGSAVTLTVARAATEQTGGGGAVAKRSVRYVYVEDGVARAYTGRGRLGTITGRATSAFTPVAARMAAWSVVSPYRTPTIDLVALAKAQPTAHYYRGRGNLNFRPTGAATVSVTHAFVYAGRPLAYYDDALVMLLLAA